jgi:hypothetical protein
VSTIYNTRIAYSFLEQKFCISKLLKVIFFLPRGDRQPHLDYQDPGVRTGLSQEAENRPTEPTYGGANAPD